jgi:2-dehydro-3-deoxyphosphooctonate aldolase (KDO 8-P synthase)
MFERVVDIGGVRIGEGEPLVLIAGPCVIEDEGMVLEVAGRVKELAGSVGMPLVFKSSFLKDNRMSPGSYAGPGLEAGLRVLERVRSEVAVPVISDVHEREEIGLAAGSLDALQIPAFLCRQTRLLEAAAGTGLPLNIKKGQFMAPEDMSRVAAKAESAGASSVLLTERGSTFGYHNLVVDMRGIEIMRQTGCPVVFDATHSVQLPGSAAGTSGGQPEFVPVLSRAAVAAGCDAIFVETHPDPRKAMSDAGSMVALNQLESVLRDLLPVARAVRGAEG